MFFITHEVIIVAPNKLASYSLELILFYQQIGKAIAGGGESGGAFMTFDKLHEDRALVTSFADLDKRQSRRVKKGIGAV